MHCPLLQGCDIKKITCLKLSIVYVRSVVHVIMYTLSPFAFISIVDSVFKCHTTTKPFSSFEVFFISITVSI